MTERKITFNCPNCGSPFYFSLSSEGGGGSSSSGGGGTKEGEADDWRRVIAEHSELCGRVYKLEAFIDTNASFKTLTEEEQERLKRQLRHMLAYEEVLLERIEDGGRARTKSGGR